MSVSIVKIIKKAAFPLRYLYHLPSDIRYMWEWNRKKKSFLVKYKVKCFGNLEIFKDCHKGKRCFIIGNGPSLEARDLDKLKGEITFASNGIYGIYGSTVWRPSYFCTGDPKFPVYAKNDIEIPLKSCNAAFFNYMNLDIYAENTPVVIEYDKVFYYYHAPRPGCNIVTDDLLCGGRPRFGTDLTKKIYSAGTISYEMLQIALYMGFSEIYLLGMDHYMPQTGKTHFSGEAAGAVQQAVDCSVWTKAFETAEKYAHKNGVAILNATRGGYLEVFPRVEFDNLFTVD